MAGTILRKLLLVCLAAAYFVGPLCADTSPARLPRFALVVGQELQYEVLAGDWLDGSDGKPKIPREADGSPKYQRHTLSVFITARNTDGSFHVVLKRVSWAGYPVLTFAELFSDGRLTQDPESMPTLEVDSLRSVFPRLPKDERKVWQDFEPGTGTRTRYRAKAGEIRAMFDGPLERVAGGAFSLRYRLDPKTSLPTHIRVDGYWKSYKETYEGLVTLKKTEQHGAGWATGFHAEALRYFEAVAKFRRLVGRANTVPLAIAARGEKGVDPILGQARAALLTARDAGKQTVFHDDLERMLKDFDKNRKYRVENARVFAKMAGRPSPLWKATDLDGRQHALEHYRGQVVVLDFWFRQCNFCIRAMPQVEQAAEHFRRARASVVFLGVCTDKEPADARHVAEKLKLTYPVLPAKEIADKYGIDSFPTLLVIDREGKVQGIFRGHSLTLREDLIACIEEILKSIKRK